MIGPLPLPTSIPEINLIISSASANTLGKALKENTLTKNIITLISGVLVFISGQIIQNFILKPIKDFYEVKGNICHKVKWHMNVLTNSGLKEELIVWASADMRDLSCQLETKYIQIPFKKKLSYFKIIPSEKNVKQANSILIFLSNNGGKQGEEIKNSDKIDELKLLLKLNI